MPAHVMLFHRLPLANASAIEADLRLVAARFAPFDVGVCEPRSLGGGVAYDLRSNELLSLRAMLAHTWSDELIPQDREPYRPHVVVQNKVDREAARKTLDALRAGYTPMTARALALTLRLYRGGTWQEPKRFPLASPIAT